MSPGGGVDSAMASVEERVQFKEGDGVGCDIEGVGSEFLELRIGGAEDGEESIAVGIVGFGGQIGACDVAGAAVDDDSGSYGVGFGGVVHCENYGGRGERTVGEME